MKSRSRQCSSRLAPIFLHRFFHRLLQAAAKHQLMVNLHGMTHPTGLHRTYPHLLTQEGVFGAEMNKYTSRVTAAHNVTIPYTRMLLGPMDYTPGGFRNVDPKDFMIRERLPLVKTTRGQALAMYVVYESPLASISDAPPAYQGQDGFDMLKRIPVVWDETRFVAGEIGKYVVLARRKGRDWYVGGMTDGEPRTVELSLDFLGGVTYHADVREDGATPNTLLQRRLSRVGTGDRINLQLSANGGALVWLEYRGQTARGR
jgi:alpha-glucosidase